MGMRAGKVALCSGIGVVAWLPALPPWWLLVGMAAVLAATLWPLSPMRRRTLAVPALGLLLGLIWATAYGQRITHSLLPPELEQQPLWLRGTVIDLIETRQAYGQDAQRFLLRVDTCQRADTAPCAVSLHTVQLTAYKPLSIASGERWQVCVKLKRPHGFANPGGFDFESWQVQRRISAVGSVQGSAARKIADASFFSVDHARALCRDWLQARLQPYQYRSLLLALLVADGSEISREQWQWFRETGTIHLFVVSGSHIAFTGGLVWWLLRCWRRLPWSTGSRREHMLCALPPLLVALAYALLAGMGLPIQRALIMFAVVLLTTAWRRDVRFFDALLLALTLVLLSDPLAARDAGCWFSFAAVAALALAFAHDGAAAQTSRWGWLRAQWLVFVVTVPVLLLIGGQLSLLSLPANLVAVPLTTVLTLPLAFAAMLLDRIAPALAQLCWQGADLSLHGLLMFLEWLRDHGAQLLLSLSMSAAGFMFALLAVLLLMLPRGTPGRGFALVLLLPVLWPLHQPVAEQALRLTMIDVGQGLSVLIETHRHHLLYDTGPAFATGSSAAEFAALPLLHQRGVRTFDMLMVSHRDSDHAGGVPALLAAVPTTAVVVGEKLRVPQENYCVAGQSWQWDGVEFAVLSPMFPVAGEDWRGHDNNRSCVLQISVGDASILLTGDIETPVEQQLLAAGSLHPATILVAAHHGSRSSSSPDFVRAVMPRFVLFSTGYRNQFGHPHPQVVQRYDEIGARRFNTARSGAVTLAVTTAGVVEITEYRREHRHYWDLPAD